ncbi:mucin-2-like isoform X13 [Hippocampus zosterae]|uniref:mucin-2-like isoform X12 n=1 Tax=Hippocampus zosterae TaxID=109293 RepID=UPI00223DE4F6|nr:mucin-2-like isoform X12 [Hippocampus zosterae]XP_051915892.1 mucin-2-like isoform X13 [Hippocampus zosterae]
MGTVAAMRWKCVAWYFLTLFVVTEVKARLVGNHVSSICSTWGREHFKTFDGDVYQFSGACEYNLASDCHEAMQEFSVHMRREQNDGNPTVAYVVVTINDLAFHLTKEAVTVNEQTVMLPYYNSGVQVENNAVYIKLQSQVGLVVMWNGDDAVMVEVDRDYANRTCGLCGDYNGVPVYNELLYNDRIISHIEFGNNQKVHHANDDCEDPFEEFGELEDVPAVDSCEEFKTTCNQMLLSEPWSSCAQLIDPAPYVQACAQDMCGCSNSTNDTCVCSTLSEFSRQCSHAGGMPPNWRTPEFCAKKCPYNMVYEESGSPCMDTCTHQDTSSLCEEHRMDGCFCPAGTVFDDISMRGCIDQSECQCKHGRIYNSSEGYQQGREICTCFQGRWSCEYLQGPATCAVEEGSHITTFDGKSYTFHGDCYYTLAKVESKDASSPKFTIQVQLVPCINQRFDTCLKALKILLNNDRNNVLTFISDGMVKQNQQTITLPYYTADINIFHASSFHILLHTSFGLQIQIQHVPLMQVYVRLNESYNGKTRGLCGNYNLVMSDELKTPQGIVEGTATSFSNTWKSNLMCRDTRERLDDPCSLSVENDLYAKHWCALLLRPNSTFEQCHSFVDPEAYYKRCTYASCNCDKSEACLCAVFSSYARACASKGVFLMDWRANVCDKYTRTCPQSQIFSYKHQRCELTCRSLSSTLQTCNSDFLPVDGCSCPEGQYLDDHAICIPKEKCPCYHNEAIIPPGKSINIKDEHCVCSNGVLHCHSWRARSSVCPPHKMYFNCSSPGSGQLGVQCAPTCLNLDSDDCDSNDCESGCQCPDGLFDDGRGFCVEKSQCPCKHDGKFYAAGTQIPNQCNTCTCRSGKWECTEEKCPGTCIIYGSGHYNTFDQRTYAFQGLCSYVAVKNKCGNKTAQDNIGVITENVACGSTGTTCSKTVRIQLGRMEIKLFKGKYEEVDLGQGNQIKYTIRTVGMYLVVESVIGMAVMWDRKTTVRILLEPQHSGEVCGLCGDFDGNEQNDFTIQGQQQVTNVLEFANSWKTSSNCPNVETHVDPCTAKPSRHHWSKMMCGIITGKTFQACHNTVDPLPFYENCVKDSCACDTGGDCECFCTAVAAYAQACNEAGVCVAWRTPDICPVYCDYYNNPDECRWHYNPCHQPCYKTCLNVEGICSNPLPNLEGCYPVCPEDKPIFDEDHQICVEECEGCFYNGTRYEEYEVIYNVTDNLGMCYYAICINRTVIFGNETCATTTAPPPTTPVTEGPTTTTEEVTRTTRSTTTLSTESPTTTEGKTTTTKSTSGPPLSSTTVEEPVTIQTTTPATGSVVTESTTTVTKSTTTTIGRTTTTEGPTTTKPSGPSTTTEGPTTTTKSTTTSAGPSTTTEGPTTTTKSTTTSAGPSTTTEGPTTTTSAGPSTTTEGPTTTTKSTTTSAGPSTTTEGPTTTTKSTTTSAGPSTTTESPKTTTPSGPSTTTEGPTTTTKSTTTSAGPSTTTEGPTTTTKSTTTSAGPSTTTEGPTTTTKSTTTSTGPSTTTEGPTTTTPSGPSTTTEGPTTTTKSTTTSAGPSTTTEGPTTTTPSGPSTTTEGPTTTTKSTTTSAGPSTTTEGPTTTTKSTTTSAGPSTTTEGPTTTTKSTTTSAGPSTTTEVPTTTTKSTTTSAGPSTTTEGPTTTTKSTTTSAGPSTTTEGPTTTTPSGPSTTTEGPTTTTKSTTTSAGPSTTTEGPTTTTKSTTTSAGPGTTTEGPTTTTKSTTTSAGPSTTTEGPTTTTKSTTTSAGPSTTTEGPTTTTKSTTTSAGPSTTTEGPTTTTKSTTTSAGPSTTTEGPTTTTKSTTTSAGPSTTTEGPTTTTKSTTTSAGPSTTTEGPTTTTSAGPSTTTEGPTTTTKSTTTSAGPSTTTEGPTTTTKSTTTSTGPSTTTEGPTTTTKSTTTSAGPSTTTEGPTTTTPSGPSTTTEGPTTTTKSTTTSAGPSTTTEGPTTTTKSTTTSAGQSTTTEGPTTTTTSGPSTTTEGPTTTTKSTTTSAGPSTTTEGPTTTTKSTTTSAGPSTTTEGPTTTTKSTTTSAGPSTTTEGQTTTTKSTTTSAGPSTTTEGPTTTTKSTTTSAGPSTTTEGPTTTTKSTTTSAGPSTTTEGPTTTTKSTTTSAGPSTTTEGPTTTTKSTTTSAGPSTTTEGPTTTTKSTTTPFGPTTTTEGPSTTTTSAGSTTTTEGPTTTTKSTTTTSGPVTTTEGPTTTISSTSTSARPTTTTEEPSTITTTPGHTTQCFCVVNGKHYNPGEIIYDMKHIGSGVCLTMICSDICEIHNKTEPCSTTPGPNPTPTVPLCPEWDVVQNETFLLCNCTMARCIENNTIEIIPYQCPPLKNITCTNGKNPVLVYDENYCCQHYVCDCECKGWGDPHYITFDGLYYSYQGNCTYVLMEEITPKYNLKIYVDNVYCDATQHVSCPRSLIISYKSDVIVLKSQNLIGASVLEAFKDEKRLRLPYLQQDIKIFNSGIDLVVEIVPIEVIITFGFSDFTVNLPSKYFDSNTQGQCGRCNNNQADDCMVPGGQIVQSCSVMADFWPAKDIYQPNCQIPSVIPTDQPLPPPTLTPCKPDSECDLLLSSVFEKCHPFVNPNDYYQGCVFDNCHVSNPAIECTSLDMYADACAQAGVCLHWRNHTTHCESDCPPDKVYKPCGPAEQPTCENSPNEQRLDYITEGCFCPDGMMLFNKESGICVDKCGCIDPEGIPREFNERFEYKCQNCICEEASKTITCQPKVCPPSPVVNCTIPGFVLINQTNPADPCCSVLSCRCQSNTCPHVDMVCPIGFTVVVSVPEGKCCPEHTCEPKNVCVHKNAEYQPGESVPVVPCQDCICTNLVDPKTGLLQVNCEVQQCQRLCEQGYRYVEPRTNECCGRCVQTHCIFNVSGSEQVLRQGDTWSPADDKCEHYTCVRNAETLTAIGTRIVCPPFQRSNCQPDTIQTAANGCCQVCVEQEKACKPVQNRMYITHKNCQSMEEVDIPYCEGSCNTYTRYSEETSTLQPTCSCCKGFRSSNRTVDLLCLNGDIVPYTYIHMDECRCALSDCTQTVAAPARRRRSFTHF